MNSLAGRTIVVTRAADQAEATTELVASFGATPVVVPLIEIVDEPTGLAQLAAFDLAGVDWVVVTSPNGAQRLTSKLEPRADRPLLAAVGSTTAETLPRCDLAADVQSAVGLLEVFPHGPGQVLVVQAVDAAPTMVEGLRQRDWQVVAISPYRAVPRTPSTEQRLAALAADAVLFASGSAARAWVDAFGLHTPPVVVAIGEQTATAATRAGLKISIVSADHSVNGMLVTLSRYFAQPN
jgi:uroporphyrinogen-III synthase